MGLKRVFVAAAVVGVVVLAALSSAGAVSGPAGPANAVGPGGPAKVTVLPTVGLQNGQSVSIHAEAPSGTAIYEMRAHLCVYGAVVTSTWDFSYEGKVCTREAVGAGDFERAVAFAGGTQSGDLAFKVGTGSTSWVDDRSFTHTITCGQGAPCALVVQLQITGATAYYTAPLCFGTGCGAEPAGSGGSTSAPTTTSTAAKNTEVGESPPATIISPFGVSIPAPTTTTTTSAGDKHRSQAKVDVGDKESDGPSSTDVVIGGCVGALGGARLFQLGGRVRRSLGKRP